MSPSETELQPWFLVNISLINFTECNQFFFYDKSIFYALWGFWQADAEIGTRFKRFKIE